MNGSIKKDQIGLGLDGLEIALVFAGLTVVIGLLIESGPEALEAFLNRAMPQRAALGGALITLGVFVEVAIGIFIARSSKRAQLDANTVIEEMRERVALAEQATAEANLARARIEAKLTSRKLNEAARAQLVELLKPYTDKHVDVAIFDHHNMEGWLFAASIAEAFRAAGWMAREFILDGPRLSGRAVTIAIASDATADERATLHSIARSFASVLNKCGISVTIFDGFTMTEDTRFENAAPFRIQVGQINVVENPL